MSRYSVRYVHKVSPSDADTRDDVEIRDGAFSDRKTLGKALRDAGVMMSGCRVSQFRVEGDKVVVFPICPGLSTYWHAIVLTKR
jgi:hypothetical protein